MNVIQFGWITAAVVAFIFVACEMRARIVKKTKTLPFPIHDDRDSIARFRDIMSNK